MRFVRTQKRSVSSVTTKGHYVNSKGRTTHHPKRSATPINFVGVDGEGCTTPLGIHRYVLFGVGEESIENPDGLSWREVFEFLYSQRKPNTAFVGFFLGYDFTQIIRSMPEQQGWALLTTEGRAARRHRVRGKAPHPVQLDGWQFDILGMKRLRIRPKDCDCEIPTCGHQFRPWMYVCDAGGFFQTSFLRVVDPAEWPQGTAVVSPEEWDILVAGKARRSVAVLDDEMRSYNRLENVVLARVMRELDKGFHAIGVHLAPSKWFGPGQAAQAWLKTQGVPQGDTVRSITPPWAMEAARSAYFGGWFEIFLHGIIPGPSYEYDINSAYPSIISDLPCLLHGTWTYGNGVPTCRAGDLGFVYAKVWSPGMPEKTDQQYVGAMLHRDTKGRILRPLATEGWFVWDEVQAAADAKVIKRLDNGGKQQILRWVKYEPCKCEPPMAKVKWLYEKRLEAGKKSPLGKAAKLVYNSIYGKFAQSVGDPIFGNPIYAALITAGCRTLILNAIATHPGGINNVSMVATDAVYFTTPHPGLPVSNKLGEWDHKVRRNLTLFKPGVYWDDGNREEIASGRNPHFKARGFRAADFASSIIRVDKEFLQWRKFRATSAGTNPNWKWPRVEFVPAFSMTTALQALRQNDWTRAGSVKGGKPLVQDSNPADKRRGLFRDGDIFRTLPHRGMRINPETLQEEWIPSVPYEKRFGMEDPWSDEYKEQFGITEDGSVLDILAWILKGE